MYDAVEVCGAVLRAYAAARACFPDQEWRQLWTSIEPRYWTEFLFAPGRPSFWDGYSPQGRSVLRAAADDLGLAYVSGAPAGMSAVLAPSGFRTIGRVPIPLLVAVEEESNVTRFDDAIARLTHVRSPVKLGITYVNWGREAYRDDGERAEDQEQRRRAYQDRIASSLARIGDAANEYTLEDGRTQYAILVGVEQGRHAYEWHRFQFDASRGPARGRWKRI